MSTRILGSFGSAVFGAAPYGAGTVSGGRAYVELQASFAQSASLAAQVAVVVGWEIEIAQGGALIPSVAIVEPMQAAFDQAASLGARLDVLRAMEASFVQQAALLPTLGALVDLEASMRQEAVLQAGLQVVYQALPSVPVDGDLLRVGLRYYAWRGALQKWRPAGSID